MRLVLNRKSRLNFHKKIWKVYGIFLSISSCQLARAYPSFIAYGYTSCLTCHFNPYGNGPLTDYGRALSATTISSRPFYASKVTTDEDLGNQSGFLGSTNLGDHIRPAFDFRRLLLVSRLDKDRKINIYQMQADANIVLKFGEDKYYFSGTIGYAPDPQGAPTTQDHLISREHYIGARLNDHWGLYTGFADVLYGIRVPDHTAYSRMKTSLAQNDQVHGVFTHYTDDKIEGGIHVFAGNLYQAEELRPKGVSAEIEYEAWKKSRVGISALYSKNDYRKRIMSGLHLRSQIAEGQSVLAELGIIHESTTIPATTLSNYLFLQSMHRIFRGLHVLANLEYYTLEAFTPNARYYRFGPSLQYYPMQRIELRADLQDTKKVDSTAGNTNTLNFIGQMHLSF